MVENINEQIERIKQYYTLLTGTPEPEQEEDAQKQMVPILDTIKAQIQDDPKKSQITDELLNSVKNWDPLDNWFNEVEGLKQLMKDFLIIHGQLVDDTAEKDAEMKAKVAAEADAKLKALEAKMKELEEKERLLREKEKSLLEKQSAPTISSEKEPKPSLHSKLPVPEIKIPKMASPKVIITPSLVEQEKKEELKKEIPQEEPHIPEPTADMKPPETSPNIKINFNSSSANPIKINPNPIKINIPKITAITADNIPTPIPTSSSVTTPSPSIKPISSESPIIQPVSMQKPSIQPVSSQTPTIQPVSMQKPSFQPVSNQSPSIMPVSSQKPSIQPVASGENIIKPNIRPIGGVSPSGLGIKPVGDIQRPNISPINQINSNNAPNNISTPKAMPTPTVISKGAAPINLFAQKPGDKKPVNLFAQQSRSTQDESKSNQDTSNSNSGKIEKVGGLDKLDFKSSGMAMGSVSEEDEVYLKMSAVDLYHQLLNFEAKRFYYEKSLGLVQQSFEKGQLSEAELRGSKERVNFEIQQIMTQVEKVRNFLTAAK